MTTEYISQQQTWLSFKFPIVKTFFSDSHSLVGLLVCVVVAHGEADAFNPEKPSSSCRDLGVSHMVLAVLPDLPSSLWVFEVVNHFGKN